MKKINRFNLPFSHNIILIIIVVCFLAGAVIVIELGKNNGKYNPINWGSARQHNSFDDSGLSVPTPQGYKD
jgi:hypothetical protein